MSLRPSLRIRPRSLRGPMLVALALIVVVVAGMFAMMVMSVRSLEAVSKAQRRTSSMTQETLQLERTVVDLETGVRGFMLTNDEIFLEPYRRGQRRLSLSLAKLADLSEPQTDADRQRDHAPPQRIHPRVHRAAHPGHPPPERAGRDDRGQAAA